MELTASQQVLMGAIYNGSNTHSKLIKGLNDEQRRQVERMLAHLVGNGLLKPDEILGPAFELTRKGFRALATEIR